MRTIDIHAHITPEGFIAASKRGEARNASGYHEHPPEQSQDVLDA